MVDMAREEKSVLGWFAFAVSVAALSLATFGLRGGSASGATTAGASVDVTLTEFTITPQMISLPAEGGTMRITNTGTAVHSFRSRRSV